MLNCIVFDIGIIHVNMILTILRYYAIIMSRKIEVDIRETLNKQIERSCLDQMQPLSNFHSISTKHLLFSAIFVYIQYIYIHPRFIITIRFIFRT